MLIRQGMNNFLIKHRKWGMEGNSFFLIRHQALKKRKQALKKMNNLLSFLQGGK